MILKLGMKHQAMELYKVYINRDPWVTLTYFNLPVKFTCNPTSNVGYSVTCEDAFVRCVQYRADSPGI